MTGQISFLNSEEEKSMRESVITRLLEHSHIDLDGKHRFRFHDEAAYRSYLPAPMRVDLGSMQSDTGLRNDCLRLLANHIMRLERWPYFDRIAGVDRGGLQLAAILAYILDLATVDVLKKPKILRGGGSVEIEGLWQDGMCLLTVEDVVTLGYSTRAHCRTASSWGFISHIAVSVFSYGIWRPLLDRERISVSSLIGLDDVLRVAVKRRRINHSRADMIRQYFFDLGEYTERVLTG